MPVFTPEEIAYRARIVEQYEATPREQRGEFAESMGMSTQLLNYWKKAYTRRAVEKANELAGIKPSVVVEKTGHDARPRMKTYPWKVEDMQMSGCFDVVSVLVSDYERHPAVRISAPAEFSKGNLTSQTQAELAERIIRQLHQWPYRGIDRTDLDFMLRRLWY